MNGKFLFLAALTVTLSSNSSGVTTQGVPPACPAPPTSPLTISYLGLSSGCSNQVGGNPTCLVGEAIQFKFADGVTDGCTTYHWDFQDSSAFGLATILHTFGAPGSFMVKVTATNALATIQATQTVNIVNSSVPTLGRWPLLFLLVCVTVVGAFRLR